MKHRKLGTPRCIVKNPNSNIYFEDIPILCSKNFGRLETTQKLGVTESEDNLRRALVNGFEPEELTSVIVLEEI